jgi:trans-2-enoyl-CoA reductase
MIAARLHGFGEAAEVLRLEEGPAPVPTGGELLVEMLASPVNPADLNIIEGKYGELPEVPAVIGNEGVGRVVAVGAGVGDFTPGDLVLPMGRANWATQLVVKADEAVKLPTGLDVFQAAMLVINPLSAWAMLEDFVTLREGDRILQNAANSAVGRCVIQIARARGLRTLNVVRRDEVIPELTALGADEVVLEEADLRAIGSDRKPRLALNAVGGASALNLANALADGGTLVTYGAMGRQPLKIPNGLLIFRGLHFQGFWLRRMMADRARVRQALSTLAGMSLAGRLQMPVHKVFAFSELHAALAEAAAGQRSGKVLIDFRKEEFSPDTISSGRPGTAPRSSVFPTP